MEAFVVRWRLSSPMVVPERPIHLDALLASAEVNARLKQGKTPEEALAAQDDLPLEQAAGVDGAWVWKASQLLLQPSSPPTNVPMTRRIDVEAMAADRDRLFTSRRQTVKIGTGPFRNYDLRVPVQWQEEVVAYGVGDLEAVRTLLADVSSLGRLRRNGWGKIAGYTVVPPAPETADGWKMRTLPLSLQAQALPDHQPAVGTCRPPYWDRAAWREVLEWNA